VRFADKSSHQIFVEPEGLTTPEVYPNGISTSLPFDVQAALVHSMRGFERAHITRPGYAIEYDFVPPTQLKASLETKRIQGLFCAGQINGTSGYEEAAGQGIMAGINAVLFLRGEDPFVLRRDEAYIAVLIDDLVTKGTEEPYRLFTSLAEYRLLLRQDNADRRLMPYGHKFGLIEDEAYARLQAKERAIAETTVRLEKARYGDASLLQLLKRPEVTWQDLVRMAPELANRDLPPDVNEQIEIETKYAGYIDRQRRQVERLQGLEGWAIPSNLDYGSIRDISNEARQKLQEVSPRTLAQASRISGVSPADISVLMIHLKSKRSRSESPSLS